MLDASISSIIVSIILGALFDFTLSFPHICLREAVIPLYESSAVFWRELASTSFSLVASFFQSTKFAALFLVMFSTCALSVGVRLILFSTIFAGIVRVIAALGACHIFVTSRDILFPTPSNPPL